MPPYTALDGLTQSVAQLSDRLSRQLGRIRLVYAALGAEPDPYGATEATLRALLDERDQIARQLTEAVVRAVSHGAAVRVEFPTAQPSLVALPAPLVEAPADPAPASSDDAAASEPAPPDDELEASAQIPAGPVHGGPAGPVQAGPVHAPVTTPVAAQLLAGTIGASTVTPFPARTAVPPPRPTVRRPPPPKRPPPKTLAGHLELMGRPTGVATGEAASRSVERLLEATAHVDTWLEYPQDVQRALVGLASSIARHLQDEVEVLLDGPSRESVRAWFPVMTQWSKLYRPGFVPGLSRKFGPDHESWLADAQHWWWVLSDMAEPGSASVVEVDARTWAARNRSSGETPEPPTPSEALAGVEQALADPEADLAAALQAVSDAGVAQRDPRLIALLVPHADRVASLPRFKTLKSALRAANGSDDDGDDDDSDEVTAAPSGVADDWPFLSLTEHKHAVIVGGDRRLQAAERIRDAFRFDEVEWELKEPRRLKGLAERVRSRSVDFVILLRAFIGHAEQETILDACRAADVPFVVVDSGYGVNQVKLAIERFCNVVGPTGTRSSAS